MGGYDRLYHEIMHVRLQAVLSLTFFSMCSFLLRHRDVGGY